MGVFKPIELLNSIFIKVYDSDLQPCGIGSSVEPKIALRARDPSDRVSFFPSWEVNLHVSGIGILEKGWPVGRWIGLGGSMLRFRADLGGCLVSV
ncbi:hypothetical protein GW17_00042596 [Ensete ventricosum]|nr:hypothetical protein GW17_00042596 [Ensete ventricosum]